MSQGVTFIESSGTGALAFTNTGERRHCRAPAIAPIALGGTNTGDNTMGGAITDAGAGKTTLAKNDSGTWVLTGNNTYTGNTVVNDGNLIIGNGGTTGNAGAGNVIVDSADLDALDQPQRHLRLQRHAERPRHAGADRHGHDAPDLRDQQHRRDPISAGTLRSGRRADDRRRLR